MSTGICVVCPFGADRGLITKAVCLVGGHHVRVLVPEAQAPLVADCGAEHIHTLPASFSLQDEAVFARWLAEKLRLWADPIVLAPATVQLRNIMPMTAWHLHAGLTADCTALSLEDGRLLQTRPAFGNNMLADVRTLSPIQMATVRPGTFRPGESTPVEATIVAELPPTAETIHRAEFVPFREGTPLGQARIILAGGLGIGSADGFRKLEALAKRLGATPAASRSAVDAGYAPYRCQVGITGVTVSPELYIAVGISGAVQHLSGMSGAKTVIAINSDPKAPIFDYADYGIVADWEAVIDELLEELS